MYLENVFVDAFTSSFRYFPSVLVSYSCLHSANANLARVMQTQFWSNLVPCASRVSYFATTSTTLLFRLHTFLSLVAFFASISAFSLSGMST